MCAADASCPSRRRVLVMRCACRVPWGSSEQRGRDNGRPRTGDGHGHHGSAVAPDVDGGFETGTVRQHPRPWLARVPRATWAGTQIPLASSARRGHLLPQVTVQVPSQVQHSAHGSGSASECRVVGGRAVRSSPLKASREPATTAVAVGKTEWDPWA